LNIKKKKKTIVQTVTSVIALEDMKYKQFALGDDDNTSLGDDINASQDIDYTKLKLTNKSQELRLAELLFGSAYAADIIEQMKAEIAKNERRREKELGMGKGFNQHLVHNRDLQLKIRLYKLLNTARFLVTMFKKQSGILPSGIRPSDIKQTSSKAIQQSGLYKKSSNLKRSQISFNRKSFNRKTYSKFGRERQSSKFSQLRSLDSQASKKKSSGVMLENPRRKSILTESIFAISAGKSILANDNGNLEGPNVSTQNVSSIFHSPTSHTSTFQVEPRSRLPSSPFRGTFDPRDPRSTSQKCQNSTFYHSTISAPLRPSPANLADPKSYAAILLYAKWFLYPYTYKHARNVESQLSNSKALHLRKSHLRKSQVNNKRNVNKRNVNNKRALIKEISPKSGLLLSKNTQTTHTIKKRSVGSNIVIFKKRWVTSMNQGHGLRTDLCKLSVGRLCELHEVSKSLKPEARHNSKTVHFRTQSKFRTSEQKSDREVAELTWRMLETVGRVMFNLYPLVDKYNVRQNAARHRETVNGRIRELLKLVDLRLGE